MLRFQTSAVWNFFDKFNENNIVKTKCKLCHHATTFHYNTSNLKDHLKRKHPLQLQHEDELQSQVTIIVCTAQTFK